MKPVILLLLVVAFANALPTNEPVRYYHEAVGIKLAERIRQAEQATDFDGSRIVGGSPAAVGMYPYVGGLVIALQSGFNSVCGSSLLTNTRAVTAAHCWFDGQLNALHLTVVLGSFYLFSGGVRINTNAVNIHENYNPTTWVNDIAIINMSWVSYTNVIQPINLPSGSSLNENFVGVWAQAAGYGRKSDNAGLAANQYLSHVTVQVIPNAQCAGNLPNILASTLCTSGVGGSGPCQSDSGGPLSTSIGGQRVLLGVVSFGTFMCEGGWPTAYARVTSFLPWIQARL